MAAERASGSDRELLRRLCGGPVSGDMLAREVGLTRAAVWKRIETLRAAGVEIEARPGRGYTLSQPLDLLDAATIRSRLERTVAATIRTLDVVWSIDSTNAELLRRPAPRNGASVLLAERQTAGRGRRGREWASPLVANVYLSVARLFEGGLARLGGLSLVAGVAVVDALRALGYAHVQLKWPNDVMVAADGRGVLRKLGGLLVEGGGEHAGPVRAVIGLGLNVRMPHAATPDIDQPWVDMGRLVGTALPSRNKIVAALLDHLLPALERFDADGLAPFLPRYAAHDALTGSEVVIQAGNDQHVGKYLGVAGDGALRLETATGERCFHAGEVSVRQSAGAGT